MAEMNFDPSAVPPDERGPMDAIPPGQYDLVVIESKITPTKAGTGTMLELTHQVAIGPFENRKIWTRHNYLNPNPEAQAIGQREIANLCAAVGIDGPLSDSNELHGIVYRATVGIEKDKSGQYADKNKISRFFPADGLPTVTRQAPVQQHARPAAQTAQQRPAAAGNRPGFLSRGTPGQTAFGR